MGFRFRKRTGGKNAWVNWFGSGNGLGASVSMKIGNTTMNVGKGRRRVTVNLGNGISWVKQRSTKKKVVEDKPFHSQSRSRRSSTHENADWLMRQFMHGMTEQEYVAWYDNLSEEERIAEDKRVDRDLARWKRERAAEDRKFKQEMYEREHTPIWQIVLYVAGVIIINPLFWLIFLIGYLFYGIWPS